MWRATSRMMLSLPPPGVVPTWIDTGLPAGKARAGCATAASAADGERGDEQHARQRPDHHRGAGTMPFLRIAATEVSSCRKFDSARAASGCLASAWMPVA